MERTAKALKRLVTYILIAATCAAPAQDPKEWAAMGAWFKDWPVLYENDRASFLKEFALSGRYEGQDYHLSGTAGDTQGWDHRRIRYGFRAQFSHDLDLAAQANADGNEGEAYQSLWNAALTWKPIPAFSFRIGKFKPRWSYEYFLASYETLTLERSLLSNQARPQITPGAGIDGQAGLWDWSVGVFSGDWDRDFGHFDTGAMYAASLGLDVHGPTHTEKAHLRLDYLGDDGHDGKTSKGPWDHNFALSLDVRQGPWGILAETVCASGGPETAYSFMLMPSYELGQKWQIVGRLQYAAAGTDVLRSTSRYERLAPALPSDAKGDRYQAVFLGLNYLIQGNHLKLMTGIEYAHMDSSQSVSRYDDWTWISGIKMYF
ncbi:MAG: outer membrane beta-barrel protein [Verrucomicrobiaceae bacterium]|nr:outer membrane beta-barrel protein [Verrucomicrobiaceae bacterium]